MTVDKRPPLRDIYMRLANDLSRRSDCTRASVGCVVTDLKGTQVYGVGYNGGAQGDTCRCSGEQGKCGCIHAEANALIKCRTQDTQKILYSTVSPCQVCAKLIVNSGFKEINYVKEHRDFSLSYEILTNGGVKSYRHPYFMLSEPAEPPCKHDWVGQISDGSFRCTKCPAVISQSEILRQKLKLP